MMFKSLHDSSKSVPFALALLVVGLLLIVCSAVWSSALAPILHLSADVSDFARGFCIGFGLMLELCAISILAPQVRSRKKSV